MRMKWNKKESNLYFISLLSQQNDYHQQILCIRVWREVGHSELDSEVIRLRHSLGISSGNGPSPPCIDLAEAEPVPRNVGTPLATSRAIKCNILWEETLVQL